MSDWICVARADEIPRGDWKVVDLDGTAIAVFNLDGVFHAIEDVCTHDGGELATGMLEGDEIVCPRHGGRFCVRTGEATGAPAYEPTHAFPIQVENGEVRLRDDRWD